MNFCWKIIIIFAHKNKFSKLWKKIRKNLNEKRLFNKKINFIFKERIFTIQKTKRTKKINYKIIKILKYTNYLDIKKLWKQKIKKKKLELKRKKKNLIFVK